MREPWVRGLLVGALTLIGYGCTPEDQPACRIDDDCAGADQVCEAGRCAVPPCEEGDLRACGVGEGVVICVGTQTCTDGVYGACEPPPEVCDGIDNDCDRRTDEGFAGLGDPCAFGDGECHDRGAIVCTADGLDTMCSARVGDPVDERCDGLDNDCDGATDEGLGGGACDTGLFGVCAAGAEVCEGGDIVCVPGVEPTDEVCDGVDNDCDSHVDEARNGGPLAEPCYEGPPGTDGVGPCAAGVRVCADGVFGACAEQALPAAEICDSIDNDCNGAVDDRDVECVCAAGAARACYSGPEGTAGVGVCTAGTQVCADDGSAWGPCEGEVGPGVELCDGEDDDCNGVIDDAIGVNALCEAGVGACAATGIRRCDLELGQVVCDAEAGLPADEQCNGVDDDCNGRIDDLAQVGAVCVSGVGTCEVAGVLACGPGGEVACAAQPGQPTDEICNGLDDDCDGVVDDVAGLGDACSVGVGRCVSTGRFVCGDGGLVCGAVPNPPGREICGNRLDDDCDGEVDDDADCADCGNGRRDGGEACDDGNRQDGDGCSAGCAVEDGFECFDGPADTPVAIDGADCADYAPADVPAWIGGYGVGYIGGVVQFAGDQQRYTASYAVRTIDAAGEESELLVGFDPDRGFREAERPGFAALMMVGRFDRLPAGDYAARFPDDNCDDNEGVVNIELRTLDACRPLACEVDADCLFGDEICTAGACVPATCGDGSRDEGETCDDGNRDGGDGCDGACQVEPGYGCYDGPDVPVAIDGLADCAVWTPIDLPGWPGGYGVAYLDGAVRFGLPSRFAANFGVRAVTEGGPVELILGRDADGNALEAGDAGAAEALLDGAFAVLPGEPRAVQFPDSACEDNSGAVNVEFRALDYCRPACEVDDDCAGIGEFCLEGLCDRLGPFCGDGEIGPGEECDDGNRLPGDGCSRACVVEPGLSCEDFSFSFGAIDSVPFEELNAPRWQASEDGLAITQLSNANPSHYASDLPISGSYVTRFELRVEDPEQDNDIIGWSIGGGAHALSAPDAPYLLFSWKQEDQDEVGLGFAPRGLRVARVDGPVAGEDLWQLRGDNLTELAVGATQGDVGWIDDRTYTVEIIGDAGRLRVYVDGQLEFDLAEPPLGDARLGVYTFSQPGLSARLVEPVSIQVCRGPDPICGDGSIDPGEGCDDGNADDGDGCSAACAVEPGFFCQDIGFRFGAIDRIPGLNLPPPLWEVSEDGRTIVERRNAEPSHYASNLPIRADYVTRFEVAVNTPTDDDFIGWTIGGGPTALSAPEQPYLLFSWKQRFQSEPGLGAAEAGLRVGVVTGAPDFTDLWQFGGDEIEEIAVASTLGNRGWRDRQTYTVEIIGDGDRIQVFVDGVREFDLRDVPIGGGLFGLYTNSQEAVVATLLAPVDLQICGVPEPFCGDGEVDDGEQCDDGNAVGGDGCSAFCAAEPGFACEDFTFQFGTSDTIAAQNLPAPRWSISADGRAVQQDVNSAPAHYATDLPISPDYVTRFEVLVNSNEDDDIVGWTIGGGPTALSAPTEPYLFFSWKAAYQDEAPFGVARVGLRAAAVVAPPTFDDLWQVDDGTVQEISAATTLGSTPWVHRQRYTIDVIGNSERLRVYVDGALEFDLRDVPFGNGNLGIFTYSQPAFRAELIEPVSLQLCRSTELCDNGEDDNGDGAVDCDDPGCANDRACVVAVEICGSPFDEDGNGLIGCDDPDCANDPACEPRVVESCDDGIDEDGDGLTDCDDPDCADDLACAAPDACPGDDRFEPNGPDAPALIEPGSHPDLFWCGADDDDGDWYAVDVCPGGRLTATAAYTFADGNIDLALSRAVDGGDPQPLFVSQTRSDDEVIEHVNTGDAFRALLNVYGQPNTYALDVRVDGCGEARERCDSGADEDGDGLADCADPDCAGVPACFCAAPDPYEDDSIVPTLLVPGVRVTDMPGCAPDGLDQWAVYGCGDVDIVGDFEVTTWPSDQSAPLRYGGRIPPGADRAGVRIDGNDALLTDWFVSVPDGCEPGDVPAPLAPNGQSLRVAGVLTGADRTVRSSCGGAPADVNYQIVRVTNTGPVAEVVTFTAYFRDAPGNLALFDEPFDGPALLDECPFDPAVGYRGVQMAPGTTLSVVVFNTGADVESNQFVLRVGPPGPAVELCFNGADDDGDGLVDCADDDCADRPGCDVAGVEICNSGFDDNGDGNVDCGDPQCAADPLCTEPAVCPGDDRYGGNFVKQLGAGTFEGLITCGFEADTFTTRLCAGGLLTVSAVGESRLYLDVAPWSANVLPRAGGPADAGATARAELFNDDPVDRLVRIAVSNFSGDPNQPELRYDLQLQIEGCAPLSRFEFCFSGVDDDGNGAVDCEDPACLEAEACIAEICDSGVDEDGDEWIGCNDPECEGGPLCTRADQVYFSVPAGVGAAPPESPTAIYTIDAVGPATLLATIPSPDGNPNGIQALAHDGQALWGFIETTLADDSPATVLGPIDLEREALSVAGALPRRLITGAAFNGLGELWMLDMLHSELIVAVGLEIDEARTIPLPVQPGEGDIAFIAADSTRFVLTTGDVMYWGDTATGVIERSPAFIYELTGHALAYGRGFQACAPALYGIDPRGGGAGTLNFSSPDRNRFELLYQIPGLQESFWLDGANAPRVHLDRAVPGCAGIFEFCSGPDGDGDGLAGCQDPDCVAADPSCAD